MEWLLEIAAMTGVLILWIIFVFLVGTVLIWLSGKRHSMNPFALDAEGKTALRKLSDFQYALWFGVFGWGWGVFLVTTLSDYVEYKYLGSHDPHLSWNRLQVKLLIWTIGGFGYGYWTRRSNKNTFGKNVTSLGINELPK